MRLQDKFEINRSRSGLPTLLEKGGAGSNTGNAQIIADPNGFPKRAIHVFTRGHLSNGEHAVIPVQENDLIINAFQWRKEYEIAVYKIIGFQDDFALVTPIITFFESQYDVVPSPQLLEAIDVAKRKARTYHCRSAMFIK